VIKNGLGYIPGADFSQTDLVTLTQADTENVQLKIISPNSHLCPLLMVLWLRHPVFLNCTTEKSENTAATKLNVEYQNSAKLFNCRLG
jgi:hypothetical protein